MIYKQANRVRYSIMLLVLLIIVGLTSFVTYRITPKVIIKHPTDYHFNCDAKTKQYIMYTEDMKEIGRIKYETIPQLDSIINNNP